MKIEQRILRKERIFGAEEENGEEIAGHSEFLIKVFGTHFGNKCYPIAKPADYST